MRRLLSVYNDPDQLTKPAEQKHGETSNNVRNRVRILWKTLADTLANTAKREANRLLAAQLASPGTSTEVYWRDFVFWEEWKGIGQKPRWQIAARLLPEFDALINGAERKGPRVTQIDLDHLQMMAECVDVRLKQQCGDLLERARHVASATG